MVFALTWVGFPYPDLQMPLEMIEKPSPCVTFAFLQLSSSSVVVGSPVVFVWVATISPFEVPASVVTA